jgi:hypothetical protein
MMVLVNILYYYGIMQRVVAVLGKAMNKIMHVSGAEALSNVASSFVGQIVAQIMIKPYLEKLTRIVKGASVLARETIKVEGEDSKKRQNANEYGTHKIVSLESIPSVSERVEQAKSRFAFLNEQIKKAKEELTRMQGRFHGEIEAVCAAEYEADVKRFKAAMEAKTRQNVNRSAKMYAKVLREYIAQYDSKIVTMLAIDQQKAMVMALNKSERIEKAQKAIAYFEGKVK